MVQVCGAPKASALSLCSSLRNQARGERAPSKAGLQRGIDRGHVAGFEGNPIITALVACFISRRP
jgi:hypothetical protein